MRQLLILAAAASLSACGLDGPDFQVKLQDSPDIILAELEGMEPSGMVEAAGLDSITKSRPDKNSILFTLPAADGKSPGTFLFAVKSIDSNTSALDVTVELPLVTRSGLKGTEFLDEDAIERELKKTLQRYGSQLKQGQSSSATIKEAGQWVAIAGVGLQNMQEFEKLAETAAMAQLFAGMEDPVSGDWGGSESGGWGDDSPQSTEPLDTDYSDDSSDYGYEADDGGWGDDAAY